MAQITDATTSEMTDFKPGSVLMSLSRNARRGAGPSALHPLRLTAQPALEVGAIGLPRPQHAFVGGPTGISYRMPKSQGIIPPAMALDVWSPRDLVALTSNWWTDSVERDFQAFLRMSDLSPATVEILHRLEQFEIASREHPEVDPDPILIDFANAGDFYQFWLDLRSCIDHQGFPQLSELDFLLVLRAWWHAQEVGGPDTTTAQLDRMGDHLIALQHLIDARS